MDNRSSGKALEITVQNKDVQLAELNQKYTQVKEDFKYNLKLIDDRDKELLTFDNRLKEFKKQLNNKDGEISELKIINDQLRSVAQQIELQIEEEKKHFIQRLNRKEKDVDIYKRQCDDALNDERQQIEQERRAVNRKLSELEAELDRQRRELSSDFETHTRKSEYEWKKKFDDLQNEQLASELKVK
ncbi:unnamed protein product [Didymodactylos carnosus]|uniref:Uncharacterized protein n=1 Tax=Didymodactylos carnosus TaxID=1234261 RepID=A0A815HST9_9BILA|nr:unnamed protein product [Didymodactylos carnosus]CAF4227507.1 unnamed protein product [Didymodactylos carnosus]